MNLYVKFKGARELEGNYFMNGLTEGNYYKVMAIQEESQFVVVQNDDMQLEAYCKVLFD